MKPVAVSKSRVLAGEIFADRKRHTKRGYFAIVFVTLLGAAFGWYIHGGIFYTLTVAAFALGASTITAAIINTDHHIYHRTSGFGRGIERKAARESLDATRIDPGRLFNKSGYLPTVEHP